MSEQPSTAKTIFLNALEIPAPEARQAYVAAKCGDDAALAAEVQDLLRHHEDLGSFLDAGPAEHTVAMEPVSWVESSGSLIGPYKLLEQIGEGGMGVVFMAEQQEPVRRRVAIKLIKPGMDTRQVIARFEAERQALAVMDHPNIARVLDAGATPLGHPYFVMELVRGVPITTFCDENSLPVRERLTLFTSLCQAIQHAHTKGIIHRDIKPSNVLITSQDGRSHVKVIDFGVAKAMGQQLTEKTLFTNFAQMIGTPLYMSPEQADPSGVDIDTRSDIYSLGVLLYELLTGSTPVDAEQLKQAAFDEVRRIIREDEPPTPSARISGSHTLPAIAAHRHTEPARLSKLVRGELDWIVMRALEKDRNRRYETANAFAVDLLHYLNDEAVLACPPSAAYRFSKFARRNRVALTTASLVVAALVLGIVASTWQAIRAETARAAEAEQRKVAEEARAAESEQRKLADEHRKTAEQERAESEKQRALAEANFQRARETVDEYFTLVSESKLLNVPGLQPLRKELLDAALNFYKTTANERTSDPSVLADMAAAYMRVAQVDHAMDRNDRCVGELAAALDAVDRLRHDYPDDMEHLRRVAGFWKGSRRIKTISEMPKDPLGAYKTLQRAIKIWQECVEQDPEHAPYQSDLASLCYLAGLLMAGLNERESLPYYERSKVLLEKLVVDQPTVTEHRADLARVNQDMIGKLVRSGRASEAEVAQNRCLELFEQLVAEEPGSPYFRGELVNVLCGRARSLAGSQPLEAEKIYVRAADLSLALAREFSEVSIFYEVMTKVLKDWGNLVETLGDPSHQQRYGEFLAQASKAVENYAAKSTDDRESLSTVAKAHAILKDTYAQRGQTELAENNSRKKVEVLERLVQVQPTEFVYRIDLAIARRDFAFCLEKHADRWDDANEVHRESLAELEALAKEFPEAAQPLEQAGHGYRYLGWWKRAIGRPDEALQAFDSGVSAFQRVVDLGIEAKKNFCLEFIADTLYQKVSLLTEQGRIDEAEQVTRRNLELCESLIRSAPTNTLYQQRIVRATQALVQMHFERGDRAQAEPAIRQAVHKFSQLAAANPNIPEFRRVRASYQRQLAQLQAADNRLDDSKESYQVAIRYYQEMIVEFPKFVDLWKVYDGLAQALAAANQPSEAAEARRKMAALLPNNARTLSTQAWQLATSAELRARDTSLALELATRAADLDAKDVELLAPLGVAHYRAGNWQQAVDVLTRSAEQTKHDVSIEWFFLAMAQQQLGNQEAARQWQAKAIERMDAKQPKDQQLLRFRAEAEELLAKDDVEPAEIPEVKSADQ